MLKTGTHRTHQAARIAGLLIFTGLLSVLPTRVLAAKYAGAFMADGGGARALAMGGAFTAVADDPSAAFWNPAGLVSTEGRNLLLMHSERFGDLIDRDFVAYAQPVDWSLLGGEDGALAVSAIRLGIDDIPLTDHLFDDLDNNDDGIVDEDELQGLFTLQDQIRFVSDSELAMFVSYAERKGDWQVGGSLKFIRQSVGDDSSLGIGVDLGLLRPGIWRNLDFGLKLQDATTTHLSWSNGTKESITPAVIPAFAYRLPLPAWNARITLATSAETRFENRQEADQYHSGAISTNIHFGGELALHDKVFLRGGFDSGWSLDDITMGAGFRLAMLTVDYAYAGDMMNIDEETHRVSITAHF
jgi:hypothetical protein